MELSGAPSVLRDEAMARALLDEEGPSTSRDVRAGGCLSGGMSTPVWLRGARGGVGWGLRMPGREGQHPLLCTHTCHGSATVGREVKGRAGAG